MGVSWGFITRSRNLCLLNLAYQVTLLQFRVKIYRSKREFLVLPSMLVSHMKFGEFWLYQNCSLGSHSLSPSHLKTAFKIELVLGSWLSS